MLRTVRRVTLADSIIGQLIDYIGNGVKEGGKLMSERELMKKLGVGRSSLREAMRAVEVMGLVVTRAGEGTFAAPDGRLRLRKPIEWGVFSASKTVRDIFEARRIIEIAVMPLIVEKITDAQIESMRKVLRSMEQAKGERNLQKFLDIDYVFHKNLAEYTKNEVLREVIALTYRTLNEERKGSLRTQSDFDRAFALHRRIVNALEDRDRNAASEAMVHHMDYTKKLLNL